jgi:hypothetical protein
MRLKQHVVVAAAVLFSTSVLIGQMVVGMSQARQLSAPAATSKPEDRCVLQGRVVNALTGEPLKKASLRLIRVNTNPSDDSNQPGQQGYSTSSEADGNFKIENIEPGDYHLSGERTGYLNGQYGAKKTGQRGTTIALRAGQQMTNISFPLTPQAVISGKVIDQDGDPVNGAMVQLVAETWQRGKLRHMPRNGSNTNDLGEYRIANVRPGKYYLVVQRVRWMPNAEPPPEPGKPDIRPVRTYYPEAPNLESATQLDVRAGQDLTGMNIQLISAATYHIRGKVVGNVGEGIADQMNINATGRDQDDMMFMFGGGGTVSKDRSFDLAGMAPGSYRLNVFTSNGQPRLIGRQDVEVGQGDVNDVQVTIAAPGTFRGQVIVEGNPPAGASPANLKNVHVFMNPAEPGTPMFGNNNTNVKEDGNFSIDNLSPGRYQLNVNAPSGTYLKSVRLGNQEVLGKDIDLSQGSGQITAVLSYGVAELDGTVQRQNGTESDGGSGQANPTPDASIVLVPDTLHEDGSGMRFGNTSGGGSFTVKNVPPGHYRAYAFEDLNYEQLQNADVLKQLEPKGTDVELKQNDKKQIQLPLISGDDMQQIYARLGIEVQQD